MKTVADAFAISAIVIVFGAKCAGAAEPGRISSEENRQTPRNKRIDQQRLKW
jgi:hypothetical protein